MGEAAAPCARRKFSIYYWTHKAIHSNPGGDGVAIRATQHSIRGQSPGGEEQVEIVGGEGNQSAQSD